MAFRVLVPRFSGPEPGCYDIQIKAPDFSIIRTDETLPPDGFLIAFKVKDNSKYYIYDAENDVWVLSRISIGSVHTDLSFLAGRDTLIPVQSEISRMVDLVINLPMLVKEEFIQMLQETLVSIATNPVYASPCVVPILVEVTPWYSYHESNNISLSLFSDDDEDVDLNVPVPEALINDLISMSLEQFFYVPRRNPAARSAVESLPNVNLDDVDYQQSDCSICLEDFLEEDEQLISMPCNHVFHQECITNWLQNSNLCPLCRFEMPVDPLE